MFLLFILVPKTTRKVFQSKLNKLMLYCKAGGRRNVQISNSRVLSTNKFTANRTTEVC